ncbi:DUF4037 domain-containing protein [Dictyobacter aurantiacus]|uniref:DUF4037 domain-containing protein n=1 Tax=Dictyobacter aurantiacus TaxID=1936993 RepID=A0A401ZJJ1_9CHLR|nr:DUF4037 domain-containing protein [Dictyobacter aurantiacus]GCE07009.1 hypothetical protein KDAU_43380 [Dictyobacter aurantiacus]
MPPFVPGLELNRRFFQQVVRPLLADAFPELRYAAALIGPGSEVIGCDTEMSVDHDWGPRQFIFLREEDAGQGDGIAELLSQRLPETFAGYAVSFPPSTAFSIQALSRPLSGPVRHRVMLVTVRSFVRVLLDYDLDQPLRAADWLTFPSHALGELVKGAVYLDEIGELTALRERFAWYPHDVWLYLLAAGWQRIGQEEHLMPRAGSVGDELGSSLIASRLVRDIINLCFLQEQQYAPYAKWFGTLFKKLNGAQELEPLLWRAQQASHWRERTQTLARAYEILAHRQNALQLCPAQPASASNFHERPFPVIHAECFAQALLEQITDPQVKHIAAQPLIGNLNQWSDNTDMEGVPRQKRRHLYPSSPSSSS